MNRDAVSGRAMPVAKVRHLFVYGSLLSDAGHPMGARLARSARRAGHGWIPGRLYRVSSYPAAVACDDRLGLPRVRGELWRLPPLPGPLLAILDGYEEILPSAPQLSAYARVTVQVARDDGAAVPAWAYLWRGSTNGLEPIVSGRWVV